MIESKSGVLHGTAGSRNNWARVCDTCRSAACTVYCRADSAYLCAGCDARIHAANCVASRHERVWVCEACERAPAAFFCKADSASLCSSCDSEIHSVNPLARRHQRVPILPIPTALYGPPAADRRGGSSMMIGDQARDDDGFLTQDVGETTVVDGDEDEDEDEDENEAASWLLPNPPVNNNNCNNNNNNSVDDYLDLVEYSSCHEAQDSQYNDEYSINQQKQHYSVPQKSYKGDSVVPVGKDQQQQQQYQSHHLNFQLGLEYDTSNTDYGYPASMSHNISVLSMDVGVVPESTMSQVSISNPRTPKGTIDLFSGPPIQIAPQLTPMDREARVLRYREKKKTRKFEKTIRYASRKAYAETRPRVKGRFAKRTDTEGESDVLHTINGRKQLWIVPSF